MENEKKTDDVGGEEKGDQTDPNLELQEKNEKGEQTPQPVPYERFQQVNSQMREFEKQLKELSEQKSQLELEQEKKRQQELKEQQKFEQLAQEFQTKYEDLEPQFNSANERIQALEGALQGFADAQMEQVPELYRTVVESMPLLERISWLTENQSKLSETKPQGVPKTPEGKSKGELSPEERRKRAKRTF